jgi:hypothetical protein
VEELELQRATTARTRNGGCASIAFFTAH